MVRIRALGGCLPASLLFVACAAGSGGNARAPAELPDDVAPPCTLENSGHPKARPITPRYVTIAESPTPGRACADGVDIVQSADELRARAGATQAPVSFETETLIVESGVRNVYAVEGDALVVATPYSCVGMQMACSQSYFAVPKVNRIVRASCPRPKAPCMAP